MVRDRRNDGIRVYSRQLGFPEAEVAARLTEQFGQRMAEEVIDAMGGTAWDDTLSWRERSMIVISALVAQGGVEDRLRTHVRWAIDNGVTREELDALITMLGIYVGYPRATAAMSLLISELGPFPDAEAEKVSSER